MSYNFLFHEDVCQKYRRYFYTYFSEGGKEIRNETIHQKESRKDNREQAIDFLKGLRANKDFLVEKENLDWLVKQEKHFGIK